MVKEIFFSNEGYVNCKSCFYTSHDVLQKSMTFKFYTGTNKLVGDIDSGIWGVSYLLSMFNVNVEKETFLMPLVAVVDGKEMPLKQLAEHSCYLDESVYPLFSSRKKTVLGMIKRGVEKSGIDMTPQEICDMFLLDSYRIEKPIRYVGNEKFRAMAAVGYAYGKEIFCFPWLSKTMYDYYTNNITWLLDILEKLNTIVILPIGSSDNATHSFAKEFATTDSELNCCVDRIESQFKQDTITLLDMLLKNDFTSIKPSAITTFERLKDVVSYEKLCRRIGDVNVFEWMTAIGYSEKDISRLKEKIEYENAHNDKQKHPPCLR